MIARASLLIAIAALAGCPSARPTPDDVRADIDVLLDDFHAAAADADAERYLAHFAENGVFFGTDPAERWTLHQFEPYVRSRFADGGWSYAPRDRTVFVSADGSTAWFDEMLDRTAGGVTARGTGVLVRRGGDWKVAQYNFSVPFPNALWDTINAMIRAEGD